MKDTLMKATREGFGEAMVELGKRNKSIMALSGDLRESLRMVEFGKLYPDQFVEVGVAEQNMVGVATGLALSGKIPFVCSFAVFSPGRNWDQIRVSVAYTNANVKIIGGHTGLMTGEDGATHQALEDIAIMRVLPNMVVIAPADSEQAKKATMAIADYVGPVYMRLTRPKSAVFTNASLPFVIGKVQVLREGRDLTIFACGPLVYEAMLAAEDFDESIDVEVINVHTIKPLDEEAILRSVRKTGKVITLEDHQIAGGLGSAISELLSEKLPVPIRRMGVKNRFGESGEWRELWKKHGLNKEGIIKNIKEMTKKI